MSVATLFANMYDADTTSAFTPLWTLVAIGLAIVSIASVWRVFEKAKKPGWGSLIPIYNIYLMLHIAGKPGWWLLLYLIPVVNIFVHIIVAVDTAKAFGKSTAFGVFGLWLFGFIGYLILGFGEAKYKAPKR